ncbi:hypothetical protein TEQG_07594 [Trichophyton equinum CBS 127.97]|uniref:Uncharacterized protein n=1 Tax=Trichophyton equinum (strain ATCC MYA-4606 / CBS 127.97) TaxID=559882 RepID=F2Q359_TRIEC|nr:hypothetical protein TEQG_07594 [Trichophyton equinum CBS 127.97]
MSRLVIRVNSDFLIDGRPETSDPIQAVVCSLSHPVFSSTKIRLFGPLGATIPLRELRVTTDEDVTSITVTPEQRMLQPWLAGSRRATYYTPYLPRDLTKPQFKVMVQFHRFARGILSSTADGSGILGLRDLREWLYAVPPEAMGCEEWESLIMEIGGLENVLTDEERWDACHTVGVEAAGRADEVGDDDTVPVIRARKEKKRGQKDRLAVLRRGG